MAFCQKHPNAQELLYGKSLNLSGRVKNIGVFGLERDRAEITISTASGRNVVLECNPERSRGARKGPYYAAREGHLGYMNEAGEIKIIASVGVTGEAHATIRSITPSSIRLWYTPPG